MRKRGRSSVEGGESPGLLKRLAVGDAAEALSMPLLDPAACGRGFCAAVGQDGQIYIWGKTSVVAAAEGGGAAGQMQELPFPESQPHFDGAVIAGVAAGNFHLLAVTAEGLVWAWGSNARGRLGIGRAAPRDGVPIQISPVAFGHRRVVSVCCGLHHSVFLLEDGVVMSAGCNENGQLGHTRGFRSPGAATTDPARVGFPPDCHIIRVASGRHHVLALSADGSLYGWGKNDSGQLGLGDRQDTAVPVRLPTRWGGRVKMFDCGRNHSLIATNADELWAFGQNVDGQLGFADHRGDRISPEELEFARGWCIKQISCGSRQTSILRSDGRVWSWGHIVVDGVMPGVGEFESLPPREIVDVTRLGAPVVGLHAGSTHTLISLQDGSTAIMGENLDGLLCRSSERVYPPCPVVLPNGERFRMVVKLEGDSVAPSPLAQHLNSLFRGEVFHDVTLVNAAGFEYHLHRVVLQARCPKLLHVEIPFSARACQQLFSYVYSQQVDLSDLLASELVQLLTTVELCSPHLGLLLEKLERTFVKRIYASKEYNIEVATMDSVMKSRSLAEWVKTSLAEHLRGGHLSESDLQRLSPALVIQLSVLSHQSNRNPMLILGNGNKEEVPLEKCFLPMLESSQEADFCFEFKGGKEPPLLVHSCFISRMAFFDALLRNMGPGQGRNFVSETPRSAMMALCRYLYGDVLSLSPWDALFLMSPRNGVSFYFAADSSNPEVDLIHQTLTESLTQMPLEDVVSALIKARDLDIPLAEAILIDRIADNFQDDSMQMQLEQLEKTHGVELVLQVQRQIIWSLLTKVALYKTRSGGLDDTLLDDAIRDHL